MLLRDYQMHPFKPIVLHIDFQRVDATTKITKKVPLHFVNEENSPAVKTDTLPRQPRRHRAADPVPGSQLPEFMTVDLGSCTKGQTLHVSDIKLLGGIKVVTHGKPNPVIVSVSSRAAAEEEEAPAADAAAVAAPAAAPAAPAKGGRKARKASRPRKRSPARTRSSGAAPHEPGAPPRRGFFFGAHR